MSGTEGDKVVFKRIEGLPKAKQLTFLKTIYSEIFEDADLDSLEKRMAEEEDLYTVLAMFGGKAIGFVIGYRDDEATFYSWLGGISEPFRRQGFAQQLVTIQEDWARTKGYSTLRTKSMNRFKPMMILNLINGFEITHVYTNDKGQSKVIFEKELND